MDKEYISQEKFIKLLENTIEAELQKPSEETDMKAVLECEHLINALMGNEHVYTSEEAEKYFAKIKEKKATKKTVHIFSKKALVASVAVFVMFLGAFTVYATSPVVREFIHKTLNLDVGNSFEEEGITYTNSGKDIKYNNIEELLNNEGLNIKYPKYVPYDSSIKIINYAETEETIYFTFDNNKIQFTINLENSLNDSSIKNAEKLTINNLDIYIFSKNSCFIAYAIINNDLYTIQCDSKEELLNIINSIK